jgi:hypothetical protein
MAIRQIKSPPFGGRVKSYYRPKGTASDSKRNASKPVDNMSIIRVAANNSFKLMPLRGMA